jgi:tRNA(fMet)-specific endonuclease VapC
MAFTHLLDTNIVSDLIRNPQGVVRDQIQAVGADAVCISIVVAAEIRFGCVKRASDRLTQQAEAILGALPILPLEEAADREYAAIRLYLETAGTPIGPNDLWIAAHARLHGLTVVTANVDEFSPIEGLDVVNWLSP